MRGMPLAENEYNRRYDEDQFQYREQPGSELKIGAFETCEPEQFQMMEKFQVSSGVALASCVALLTELYPVEAATSSCLIGVSRLGMRRQTRLGSQIT